MTQGSLRRKAPTIPLRVAAATVVGTLVGTLFGVAPAVAATAPVPVSVFNFPGLNGGAGALDCSTENANLISIVDALDGYEVDGSIVSFGGEAWAGDSIVPKPDGYTVDTFATLLRESRFFFMTDMEAQNPNDVAFLPVAARDALAGWVTDGGVMVMTGTYGSSDTDFLNLVFGWDLTTASASPWAKDPAGTTDTPFEGVSAASLPGLSATDAIGGGTVSGFTPMWGTQDNATVATIPHGRGTVIFLGYDFYDTGAAAPAGGRDGAACGAYSSDWVQQVLPAALAYASALSDTGVADVTSDGASFTYAFPFDGTVHYVVVPADAPTPTAEQIQSGSYDGGTVAIAGSSPVVADEPLTFPLAGLAPTTTYRIHAITRYQNPDDLTTSIWSEIRTTELTTLAPAPTIRTAGGDGRITVTITIDPAATVTNYEYSLDRGATWQARTPSSTTSPLVIEGLTNGTSYPVQVRAVSGAVAGLPSGTAEATPRAKRSSGSDAPELTQPKPVPDTSGELPALPPGRAGAMIGSSPADVRVEPIVRGGAASGLALVGDGFGVALEPASSPPGGAGVVGGALRLTRGDGVEVHMNGFRPQSPAQVWAFSEPQLLGEFTTDTSGGLDAALAVLPEQLSACQHTLQVVGTLPDGEQVAASLGVWVQDEPYPFGDLSSESVHGPAVGCLTDLGVVAGIDDDTFAGSRPVSRGQAATTVTRVLGLDAREPAFADTTGTTHAGGIGAIVEAGLMVGFGDGTFRPGTSITRGQAASLLAAGADLDTSTSRSLPEDVATSRHRGAIGALLELGIMRGHADGTFRPDETVTRGQFASMLVEYLEHLERGDA